MYSAVDYNSTQKNFAHRVAPYAGARSETIKMGRALHLASLCSELGLPMCNTSKQLSKLSLVKSAILWFSAAFLALNLLPAYSQTPNGSQTAPAGPEQTPSVTTNVDEVSLDLVVRDKKHASVRDLSAEDLVITDNGVPVKLTDFRLVTPATPGAAGPMITILFDGFHGPIAKSVRSVAERILKVLPANSGSMAVLDITNRLRLIQGFTEDRAAVEQAVSTETESNAVVLSSTHSLAVNIVNDQQADQGKANAASAAEKNLIAIAQTGLDLAGHHVEAKERARARALVTALEDAPTIAREQHAQLNLACLLALVKSQQRIGDRKALIYFTQNQHLDSQQTEILKKIGEAAAEAGVSIYAVDMYAVGNSNRYQETNLHLNGLPPFDPAATAAPDPISGETHMQQMGGAPIQGNPDPSGGLGWGPKQDLEVITDFARSSGEDRTDPFADAKSPMVGLAKTAGGGYIDALNNIRAPLEEMARDLTTYYQASYVPPFKDYDGKFRAIAVKPLRAGLNVETRTGYYALAPGADAGIRPFELPLLKLLGEPALPSDFKFRTALLRFGDLPDGNANTLAVEVPLSALAVKNDESVPSVRVSIVAQVKDKSGVVVQHFSEDITRRGALETLTRDPYANIALERHFQSTPGEYTLEVAVLDQNSGKASAQRSGFEIPDAPTTVALSDIVLVSKMEGAHEEDEDPLEPLRYEHKKVTPNVSGELPANAKGVSLFFIMHPDPALKDPLELEMQVIHNGIPGKRSKLMRSEGIHAAIPYLASFGSGTLAPGKYEITASLSQGGKTATQSKVFSVARVPGGQSVAAKSGETEEQELAPYSDTNSDAEITLDAENQPVNAAPHPATELAITPLASPAPPVPKDEAQQLLEEARQHALDYNDLLPNFICTEVTNRSIDPNGNGRWKLRDTLVESVRYRERTETRTMLEVNGKSSNTDREAIKGTLSAGEFGGVMQAVFRAAAKTDFQWKETDSLKGAPVQVYNYRVERENSSFSVTGSNGKQLLVAFNGQVFIDSASRRVRRITLAADGLPADFPTHATSISVDYDYVPISGLKYLMPVSAELRLTQGVRQVVMNTMEFRDYKRFISGDKAPGGVPDDVP
jgi:VWFA-related protein